MAKRRKNFQNPEKITLQSVSSDNAEAFGREIQPTLGNFTGRDQKGKLTAFLLLPRFFFIDAKLLATPQ